MLETDTMLCVVILLNDRSQKTDRGTAFEGIT